MSKETAVSAPEYKGIARITNDTLALSAINAQIGFLQGQVLTIVDASYSSPTQNKAIKDLIKDAFRSQLTFIGQLARREFGGQTGDSSEG